MRALVAAETSGSSRNALDTVMTETAALIKNLDLVISVCTSTAHLAGALGREHDPPAVRRELRVVFAGRGRDGGLRRAPEPDLEPVDVRVGLFLHEHESVPSGGNGGANRTEARDLDRLGRAVAFDRDPPQTMDAP